MNGLSSGFTGEGSKTVLPAEAMGKISMRLVPDQTPEQVTSQLEAFLRQRVPATVRWELKRLAGGPPSISARESAGVRALARALERGLGRARRCSGARAAASRWWPICRSTWGWNRC